MLLCQTCKDMYTWVTPVLYSSVVLAAKADQAAFEYALRCSSASFEIHQGCSRGLGSPLGGYVRNLWLGETRSSGSQHTGAATQAPDRRDVAGQGLGRDTWAHATSILRMCPSLHALALVNFLRRDFRHLSPELPRSLASLSLRLDGRNAYRTLPDLTHLPSLRHLTILHTHIPADTLVRILQLPRLRVFTRLCDRRSDSTLYAWPLSRALTCLQDAMEQLTHLTRPSGALERIEIASLHCDLPLEKRPERLDALLAQHGSYGALRTDGRVAVSARDARDEFDEVDTVKTLYDDWVAGLDPRTVGCAPYTQNHVSRLYYISSRCRGVTNCGSSLGTSTNGARRTSEHEVQ